MSDEDMAQACRSQAYLLMDRDRIAATYLVLAAASLAPSCPEESDVADYFAGIVKDFADEVADVHRTARRRIEIGEARHGTC